MENEYEKLNNDLLEEIEKLNNQQSQLLEEIKKLTDKNLTGDDLDQEIKRAMALNKMVKKANAAQKKSIKNLQLKTLAIKKHDS